MLVAFFINVQVVMYMLGLCIDKYVWNMCINSESTKRNDYRYSEVVHKLWLQDYPLFCWYKFNMCTYIVWY